MMFKMNKFIKPFLIYFYLDDEIELRHIGFSVNISISNNQILQKIAKWSQPVIRFHNWFHRRYWLHFTKLFNLSSPFSFPSSFFPFKKFKSPSFSF